MLNSELKVLQITKDLQVKLKQDFNFGKIQLYQSNAKTDWSFKLKMFNDKLLQESSKLYDLVQELKYSLSKSDNNHQKSVDDEGDLYDEQTDEFIGIQLGDNQLKPIDQLLKKIKQSKVQKYMPQIIELFEQLKQQVEALTKKYGEGKHGEKVKEQFYETLFNISSRYSYIIYEEMQNKYGRDLQKLPNKEQQQFRDIQDRVNVLMHRLTND